MKDRIATELEGVRRRSLALLEPVSNDDLRRQHSPLMSPLVWDLAHVGNYEEQWLLGAVADTRVAAHLDGIYDAFRNPRQDRPRLDMLGPSEARAYVSEIRGRVLDVLDGVELDDGPLVDRGFVYGMVVQHEHQHDETMTATLQLRSGVEYPLADGITEGDADPALPSEVRVDGGPFVMGTDLEPWAYDNERPAHTVDVDAFYIDTTPVTNGVYAQFIADGGYSERAWWTDAGWAWVEEASLEHPEFWLPDGAGGWARTRFGRVEAVPPDEPVQHVCWYEADAYARWAGKRLPTEAEWEKAASWTADGVKRRFPWGDEEPTAVQANLSTGGRFSPAPAGSFAAGASPWGCRQMIGDVWEWTSSDFAAYPGFRAFPYREYSEVFFGADYKVLRGGSWATHPTAIRTTFRNWDYPIRRQIFSGFRCARDA
ncbi:MAG: ergothioneine biosynthesis protein EgtB [Acidimicrobiia bacterium]|nr:ergothioneine biosynthesis protein EgtB [Acidimicrobiia bacterium]